MTHSLLGHKHNIYDLISRLELFVPRTQTFKINKLKLFHIINVKFIRLEKTLQVLVCFRWIIDKSTELSIISFFLLNNIASFPVLTPECFY